MPLFDASGKPRSGYGTGAITLYDAGTEVDEAPGYGPNQASHQAGPNSGTAENGSVTAIGGPIEKTVSILGRRLHHTAVRI